MALTVKVVKKQKLTHRPGYDVTAQFQDADFMRTSTFYFASATEPTDKDLEARIAHIQANIQHDIDNPIVPDKTEQEIIDILVAKELLEVGQTVDDLKTKAEILAEEVSK